LSTGLVLFIIQFSCNVFGYAHLRNTELQIRLAAVIAICSLTSRLYANPPVVMRRLVESLCELNRTVERLQATVSFAPGTNITTSNKRRRRKDAADSVKYEIIMLAITISDRVSRLVILHEEAEDGNAMPDLTRPVDAVSRAVENLVHVGYDTCHSSDDDILKQDMPPALQRVESSSRQLEEACYMLKDDPYSSQGRKKLIEGARGILQGTSALLLCFDESEVRKIVRVCQKVLDYLAVSEVIENMEDLVQFVRDISPWLTKMSRETEAREKELTHQVHREILIRCIDSVKTLAPILICAMKIFIQISSQGGKGIPEAAENRNYLSTRVVEEVNEVIRVLQLTTYDEDEWDEDDLIVMKKALSAIESLLQAAFDWLADPRALRGGVGEKSLRRILEYSERIASRALPEDASQIRRACSDISSMTDSLCELRHNKQGDSPQAQGLARGIAQKLRELVGTKELGGLLPQAVHGLERAGVAHPAHTVLGRIEQVLKWLANPHLDDKGVGMRGIYCLKRIPSLTLALLGRNALASLLDEARRMADLCSPKEKYAINQLCDEIDRLCEQLTDLQRKGMLLLLRKCRRTYGSVGLKIRVPTRNSNSVNGRYAKTRLSIVRSASVPLLEPLHSFHCLLQELIDQLWNVDEVQSVDGDQRRRRSRSAFKRVCKLNPYAIGGGRLSNVRSGDSPQARATIEQLRGKLHDLKEMMDRVLLDRVVDDFADITTPLKQFAEAVVAPEGTPGREQNFNDKAQNLRDHCQRCAHTGRLVGTAGPCKDKKIVESLCSTANQVANMTPQVINAGKIRFHYPQNVAADEHFENLRRELADALARLRNLVDDAVDPADFVKASEDAMRRHGQECEKAISNNEPQKMVDHTSSIARLANRVLMATKGQAENSEDPIFSGRLNDAADRLQSAIPPMVTDAKQVALNPRDQGAVNRWRDSNGKVMEFPSSFYVIRFSLQLLDAVGNVRRALEPPTHLPDMRNLDLNDVRQAATVPLRRSTAEGRKVPIVRPCSDLGYESDTGAAVSWTRPAAIQRRRSQCAPLPEVDFRSMFDLWLCRQPGVDYAAMFDLRRSPMLLRRRSPSQVRTAPPPQPALYQQQQAASHREGVASPFRPPPPMELRTPPRPPPPQETDDEEEMRAFWERVPLPKANQPILSAAHSLHREVQQWSSRENEIVAAAKRMAILMARLSQLVRGEGGTKKDLIDCAKAIADASEEVTRLAVLLAKQCTDIKMRKALLQVCERIPTIATQLKILSTVKATMLGSQAAMVLAPDGGEIPHGTDEDEEAMQQLVLNAQNLMQSVKDTVRAAEAASIKIRTDSGLRLRWVRKPMWSNY
ncbi:vinculin family protein, partial [Trichuris suis]